MAKLNRGIEIERKYIIMKPSVEALITMPDYTVSDIEQTYLASDGNVTHRVRARMTGGITTYYETKKTRIDAMSVIEDEGVITAAEYNELLQGIDPATRTLKKTRHTFSFGGLTVEIDVYPEWEHTAIMECELPSRETVPTFPDFIKILREVTGVKGYSNASMSRRFPPEESV